MDAEFMADTKLQNVPKGAFHHCIFY